MKKKNSFYVIIESNGDYKPYDILPYLSGEWGKLKPRDREAAKTDIKEWVRKELQYQFWGRCEYEFLLLPWPPGKNDTPKKIDLYWQALPNLDLITKLFTENEGIA